MPVVIVGPLAFDDVRTPTEARADLLGGSGAYAGIAAAKLAPTALVSVAGDDLRDADLLPLLASDIDLSGLERRTGRTLRWAGTYRDDFTRSEVANTELGVVRGWRPTVPRAWADTPYVLLANTDPSAQSAALAQLRPAIAVLDTMEEWIAGHRRDLDDVIAAVGVVSVNEAELASLTGGKGAGALLRRGPRAVIVKRGREGAVLVTAEGSLAIPAYPATVVDPTGAGDALAGAFTARLAALGRADGAALRDAVAYGMAAASFAIGSFSVSGLAAATREELEIRARWMVAHAGTGTAPDAPLYEGR
ncbi:MAG TPA: PfkB family carbohydrate kinase [Candidatus Limnocylindria bacterium]